MGRSLVQHVRGAAQVPNCSVVFGGKNTLFIVMEGICCLLFCRQMLICAFGKGLFRHKRFNLTRCYAKRSGDGSHI